MGTYPRQSQDARSRSCRLKRDRSNGLPRPRGSKTGRTPGLSSVRPGFRRCTACRDWGIPLTCPHPWSRRIRPHPDPAARWRPGRGAMGFAPGRAPSRPGRAVCGQASTMLLTGDPPQAGGRPEASRWEGESDRHAGLRRTTGDDPPRHGEIEAGPPGAATYAAEAKRTAKGGPAPLVKAGPPWNGLPKTSVGMPVI